MEKYENLNGTGEITELLYVAKELEKYDHLGAVAIITEELYNALYEE